MPKKQAYSLCVTQKNEETKIKNMSSLKQHHEPQLLTGTATKGPYPSKSRSTLVSQTGTAIMSNMTGGKLSSQKRVYDDEEWLRYWRRKSTGSQWQIRH